MLWQACSEWGSKDGPAEQNADTSASAQSPAPMKKYLWIASRVAGSCNASKHLHQGSHITIFPGVPWQPVPHDCRESSKAHRMSLKGGGNRRLPCRAGAAHTRSATRAAACKWRCSEPGRVSPHPRHAREVQAYCACTLRSTRASRAAGSGASSLASGLLSKASAAGPLPYSCQLLLRSRPLARGWAAAMGLGCLQPPLPVRAHKLITCL